MSLLKYAGGMARAGPLQSAKCHGRAGPEAPGEALDQVIEFRVTPEIDLHRRHGLQHRLVAVRRPIVLKISPNCERAQADIVALCRSGWAAVASEATKTNSFEKRRRVVSLGGNFGSS